MKFVVKIPSLLICAGLLTAGCLEEINDLDKLEKTTFKPTISFPLISSDFTLKDFLTEGKSKAKISEQGGLMVLQYRDSIETPLGDKFFTLPNQLSPIVSITGPEVSFPSPGATITVTKNINFPFSTSQGESIDSILLKAGTMDVQMASTFPANVSVTIAFAGLKLSTGSYQQTFSFTGPGSQTPSTNLKDGKIDLTGPTGTSSNAVTLTITAKITDTGQPINSTHRFDFRMGLNSLAFRAMFGSLGTRNYSLRADSINVDVFDHTVNGALEFLSPSVKLTMQNSFGVPINFDIQNIVALKGTTAVKLSGAAVTNPLNPYALAAPSTSQRGQSVSTTLSLTPANSNIPKLLSSLPEFLAYQFNLALNPNGPVKNFVQDDSKVKVLVDLELPLHLRASGLTLTKEFDFDGLGVEDAAETKIKVKTVNEAPFDALLQIYFVSGTGAVIDSLFTNRAFLKGPAVDANGFTQTNATLSQEVALTNAKVDRINSAKKLLVATTIATSTNGTVPVKFSSADKIQVSIGVSAKVEYTVN